MARPALSVLALAAVLLPDPSGAESRDITADLLEFIRAVEAPGGYDEYERRIRLAPPRPLTAMSVGEVLAWQDRVRGSGAPSTAAGAYQIIRPTLARLVRRHRLDPDAAFDPAMQDRMARLLLAECGERGPPSRHVRYGNCLAGIWAALPLLSGPGRGRSAHRGIAGNRALAKPETVLALLAGRHVALPHPRIPDPEWPVPVTVLPAPHPIPAGIPEAMDAAARTPGALPASIRRWSVDPYAVD